LLHATDDADQLVADDGDAGRILEILNEGIDGGLGGVEPSETGWPGAGSAPVLLAAALDLAAPCVVFRLPVAPGALLEGIERGEDGGEGGRCAGAGLADDGDPEDGALDPATADIEPMTAPARARKGAATISTWTRALMALATRKSRTTGGKASIGKDPGWSTWMGGDLGAVN